MNLSLMRDRMYFFDPVSVDINDPFYAPEMCLNSTQYISGTEGFMDTVKSAAKAIWEFIKKALIWCKDKVMWLVHKFIPGKGESLEKDAVTIEEKEKHIDNLKEELKKATTNASKASAAASQPYRAAQPTSSSSSTNGSTPSTVSEPPKPEPVKWNPALENERQAIVKRAFDVGSDYDRVPFKNLVRQLLKLNDDILNYNKKVAAADPKDGKASTLQAIRSSELTGRKIATLLRASIMKPGILPEKDIVGKDQLAPFALLAHALGKFETSVQSKDGIRDLQKLLDNLQISEFDETKSNDFTKILDPNSFQRVGESNLSTKEVQYLLDGGIEVFKNRVTDALRQIQGKLDTTVSLCDACEKKFNDGTLEKLATGSTPQESEEIKRMVADCLKTIRKYIAVGTKNVAAIGNVVARYGKCVQEASSTTIQILHLIESMLSAANNLFLSEGAVFH